MKVSVWLTVGLGLAPFADPPAQLEMHRMMEVMETVWPMVETVRKLLDGLVAHVEQQLAK
jgi:hypothetical protein